MPKSCSRGLEPSDFSIHTTQLFRPCPVVNPFWRPRVFRFFTIFFTFWRFFLHFVSENFDFWIEKTEKESQKIHFSNLACNFSKNRDFKPGGITGEHPPHAGSVLLNPLPRGLNPGEQRLERIPGKLKMISEKSKMVSEKLKNVSEKLKNVSEKLKKWQEWLVFVLLEPQPPQGDFEKLKIDLKKLKIDLEKLKIDLKKLKIDSTECSRANASSPFPPFYVPETGSALDF